VSTCFHNPAAAISKYGFQTPYKPVLLKSGCGEKTRDMAKKTVFLLPDRMPLKSGIFFKNRIPPDCGTGKSTLFQARRRRMNRLYRLLSRRVFMTRQSTFS